MAYFCNDGVDEDNDDDDNSIALYSTVLMTVDAVEQ